MTTYRVRQHIPNYVTDLDPQEVEVEEADIANPDKVPWMKKFQDAGFVGFTIEPYHDAVLIISARYEDGKSWVCSTARPL